MITLRLRHIFIFTFAILLTACQFEDDQECPDNNRVAASFINLTIAVSNGDSGSTRADDPKVPLSGEDGNGRRAGFERENAVTGITLILYKATNGLNTNITAETDPSLDFVRFYPVTRSSAASTQGTTYTAGTGDGLHNNQIEAWYTTGPQPIGKDGALVLDPSATYHAVVVANLDLTGKVSKLSEVKEYQVSTIYSGGYGDDAKNIVNFVMSSEEDNTITLSGTRKNYDGTTRDEVNDIGKDILYDLSNQPLIIERMAARIDFWAKGANYQTKNGAYDSGTNDGSGTDEYTTPGYVYIPQKVDGSLSNDRFVLTRITPFNLNGGKEYLLKHLSDGLLKSELGNNYVLDPATAVKNGDASPTTFVNTITSLGNSLSDLTSNTYGKDIRVMHGEVGSGKTGGFIYTEGTGTSAVTGEDVIICYPVENTLPDNSSLYFYATGIAIEGDYYTGDDITQKEHRVYYTFIRHQGEKSMAYEALLPSELASTVLTSSENPMNFGIVRNNIYRVYVDHVKAKTVTEEPKVTLKIKVKKWDKFEHAPIYM